MNILHICYSDTLGGASRAAYRLHSALRQDGINSKMLVLKRETDDENVDGISGLLGEVYRIARDKINSIPIYRYPSRDPELFSPAWLPERREKQVKKYSPDIINLHWVAGGYLRPSTISNFDVPVVWTFHDMWPFTGGCHYSKSCTNYIESCGNCPHLNSTDSDDLSHSIWKRKHAAWSDVQFTVVSPSKWLAGCAADSALFSDARIEVIPNGLDTDAFRPRSETTILDQFGIDRDSLLICFGAASETPRKGTDLFYEALQYLDISESIEIATFGGIEKKDIELDKPINNLGFIDKKDLSGLYSDADVMVVPSRQEAFGQTASEALSSGTPVVGFDATGIGEIVDHKQTGYLAEPFVVEDLAEGIEWILSSPDRLKRLSNSSREAAKKRYSMERVSAQYIDLYRSLL